MHSGGGSVGNKVVATLRADGKVYPTEASMQLANLLNYKIRTEGELLSKTTVSSYNAPATVVDLGKQLLQCARDSDVNGVKNALSRGAPYSADWLGMSALHFAAMNNQLEICEILLHGGINKDVKTKVDRTPLHVACFYGHEAIVELLLSKKCSVNSRDMLRMTPLHWAVEKRHKSIVRLLLKHNADVTAISKFGKTPLALAVLTEQADLLAELEAARQAQANRKFNEESEKETSEAVNTIMGINENSNIIDESDTTRLLDEQHDNGETYEHALDSLEQLKGSEAKMLGNSAMNMLKSHGIAMIQEEDDASKDLLNTALQNGRQLILSEGGRMLLHETQQNLHKSTNGNNINNNNHISGSNQNNNNNNNHIARIKPNVASAPQKIRMNVIKPKEASPTGVAKNKNIRIISLTDFKKLCVDSSPRSLQKIPASLASSAVVRQLRDGTKLVNMRQLQSRKLKLPSINEPTSSSTDHMRLIEEDLTSNEAPEEKKARISSSSGSSTSPASMRLYPAKRAEQMGTVQTLQLRPMQQQQQQNSLNTTTTTIGKSVASKLGTRMSNNFGDNSIGKQPNVMPLLTPPEICRQLMDLRRQYEDMRRKFELAEKEKDELRQRLKRLEDLMLPDGSVEELNEC